MTILGRVTAVAATALLALGLAACAPDDPATRASGSATPSATPKPTAGADASATPGASDPAAAPDEGAPAGQAAACDTALTPEEYASFTEGGIEFVDDGVFGPVGQEFKDAGAVTCRWVLADTDIQIWYAELPASEREWGERAAALQAQGWTASDAPLPGTLLAPLEYDPNFQPAVQWTGGVIRFGSYPELLLSVAALQ